MADPTNKVYYCPIELSLDLIGDKWKPTVLRHFLTGSVTVADLERRMPLTTRKTIESLLHDLEQDGLVERGPNGDLRNTTLQLTAVGRQLVPTLEFLGRFGQEYARSNEIEILEESPGSEPRPAAPPPVRVAAEGKSASDGERWMAWSWLPL